MKYILHDYRRCPFCIRVRVMMYLKGISYERVHEPLRVWTPWMLTWSASHAEKPRVPVLQIIGDNGTEKIIAESNEINLYLDAAHGDVAYTPDKGSLEYAAMERWFTWCDTQFKPMIDLYKYGKARVFDDVSHKKHEISLRSLLQELEDTLMLHDYLIGQKLLLADIAIIPFMRQIMHTREGEFDFSDYPHLTQWASRILDAPWFVDDVMLKTDASG